MMLLLLINLQALSITCNLHRGVLRKSDSEMFFKTKYTPRTLYTYEQEGEFTKQRHQGISQMISERLWKSLEEEGHLSPLHGHAWAAKVP